MRRIALVLVLLLAVLLMGCSSKEAPPAPQLTVTANNEPFVLKGTANLKQIARLIGADSINHTDKWGVAGADLGSMFNIGDKTYFVFGDTFGQRDPGFTGGGGEDWRSNVLAISSDSDPEDGITFDSFIADEKNHANELIPSLKVEGKEVTTIPTHGVAVGNTMYLYFMSVYHWGDAGMWDTNYAGVSRSTDGGKTWEILPDLKWDGKSNFIQVAPFKIKNADGTTDIYFWCIPAGRFGGVKLMKVPETEIEKIGSYTYFTGTDAAGQPQWSSDMNKAALVLNDTVGELSVIWNPYLGRWLMSYLRGGGDVVLREGLNPWGPWGDPVPLMTQAGFPGLYGPFMNPKFMADDGKTIYFCISQWGPYAVYWMKATLVKG